MRFEISIIVKYRADTVPEDMDYQLEKNVSRCIENATLLNDVNLEAVVEQYALNVEELEESGSLGKLSAQ